MCTPFLERHIKHRFSFAASAHWQTSCFCNIFLSPCSAITEQKWNKDHCGMSPGCLRHGSESTAVFHIKPKILGPYCCLLVCVCVPVSLPGKFHIPHKGQHFLINVWQLFAFLIQTPLAERGLLGWQRGTGPVCVCVCLNIYIYIYIRKMNKLFAISHLYLYLSMDRYL